MFNQVKMFAESEFAHFELIHSTPFCRDSFVASVVRYARNTMSESFDHDELFDVVIDPILGVAE